MSKKIVKKSIELGGRTLSLEVGRFAEQASAAEAGDGCPRKAEVILPFLRSSVTLVRYAVCVSP